MKKEQNSLFDEEILKRNVAIHIVSMVNHNKNVTDSELIEEVHRLEELDLDILYKIRDAFKHKLEHVD